MGLCNCEKGLEGLRNCVYSYFDEHIKPIIMEDGDDVIEHCKEKANLFPHKLTWIVRKYGDTVRVSAWSLGYGYMFFTIATPYGKQEYDFGTIYYGSR